VRGNQLVSLLLKDLLFILNIRMTFYNKICDRLFLGSVESSTTFSFLEENNISVIVNFSKDLENKYQLNLLKPIEEAPKHIIDWLYSNSYCIKYYRVPIDDNQKDVEIENFYNYIIETIDKVIAEYDSGKTILFHCLAGNQRSAAGIVAFLMKYKGMTLDESIKYVLTQKPNVFFFGSNVNFIKALQKYEKYLKIINAF
jgi:protein-tyrosine phosphatase